MSRQGPAYGMLVRDRTAAIDDMKSLQLEATENSANWTVIQFGVHLEVLESYWQASTAQLKPLRPSEIKVSNFSGKYTEWSAWRAEFQAKVLDTRLSPADKITLLLGALTKEAAKCAGQAEWLDEIELDRIWSKLDRTYDNKYQQVYQHVAQIIHISPNQHPSADKLRAMIDTVDEHLRMLKRFNIETDHWGLYKI